MRFIKAGLTISILLALGGAVLAAPESAPSASAKTAAKSAPAVFNPMMQTSGGPGSPGAERQTGLIDILKKNDDVYLDLRADQLDKPFLIEPSLASGVGTGAFAGRMYDAFVVKFERRGNRIFWVEPNSDFTSTRADAEALQTSIGESTISVPHCCARCRTKTFRFCTALNGLAAVTIGTELSTDTAPGSVLPPGTLPAGVYTSASTTFTLTGANLTLDGGGNSQSVFVFQMGSTLNTAVATNVILQNGANACNIFWVVGTGATLAGPTFSGNILAGTAISINPTVTSILGRTLAKSAVTIAGHVPLLTITNPGGK